MKQFEAAGDRNADQQPFSNALFARFDLSVTSDRGVKAMQRAVTNNIKTILDSEKSAEKYAEAYKGENFRKMVAMVCLFVFRRVCVCLS